MKIKQIHLNSSIYSNFTEESGGGGSSPRNNPGNYNFLIGTGIHDITGPAAELGMMGYSMPDQTTAGIHMRLRSRAFVVVTPRNGNRIALVSADLGMIFHGIKQHVLKKLTEKYGSLYTDTNVLLSANHTHSGPGGFSHRSLYNLSILGFDQQNFTCIVDGIYESIVKAHNNLTPGRILINKGTLSNVGMNRSLEAYNKNPQEERDQYDSNINKEMTLLKFEKSDGKKIGMLNWFALHSTNLGNKNRLISGDNKGYASYLFEKEHSIDYYADETFVAAFAQAAAGDVSPNIWGYPDGDHDFERMNIIGMRQFDKAKELYENASIELSGNLEFRHTYIDFSNVAISPEWVNNEENIHTCPAAIGFSKIAGSTEDGIGVEFITEGMVWGSTNLPKITFVPQLQECHKEKHILIPTGDKGPFHLTQEILPIQIVTLGNVALMAVPFECTTMAGRRLKNTVKNELAAINVNQIVIAGYANAYAGYVTTREEYEAQHYEGSSTHFGPYTLNAYQQEFHKLAVSLKDSTTIEAGPIPPDLSDKQIIKKIGVLFDFKPLFKRFGDVRMDAKPSYLKGQTVKVEFWGAHPRNDLKIQDTYLAVECRLGDNWDVVSNDGDPDTLFRWKRVFPSCSKITVEWTIPHQSQPGEYRIRHFGRWKNLLTGKVNSYSGASRTFFIDE